MEPNFLSPQPLPRPATPKFFIGPVPVWGDLVLAPMDGYSNLPFRWLARQLGSAISYTEFLNGIDVVGKQPPFFDRKLAYFEAERPVVYQLFDNDPYRMREAAQRLMEKRPDIIDINLGCPDRNVNSRGAGSALLKDPAKIAKIFDLLIPVLPVPVTAKIRLGWDENSQNYLDIARLIEDHGGALLAVHGRTRAQGYTGQANWDAIAEVKQALHIPVIGNGDAVTVEDVERMFARTGCDAVMIGRAARQNPWIFSRRNRADIPASEVYRTATRHLEHLVSFYGETHALLVFRKSLLDYLSPYGIERRRLLPLLTCDTLAVFTPLYQQIWAEILPAG